MKVMCIRPFHIPLPAPEVGDIDEVYIIGQFMGVDFYGLERFSHGYYRADHFAPLDDTPEEVIEEKEPELQEA